MTPIACPHMCRTDILTDLQRARFRKLLTCGAEHLFAGIALRFYNDGESLHLLARPRVIVRDGDVLSDLTPTSWAFSKASAMLVRNLLYDLLEDSWIAQQLENIDEAYKVFPAAADTYDLLVLDGCAIISVTDPDRLASDTWRGAGTEGELISLDPRVCTLILEPAQARHAALAQIPKVTQAIMGWKGLMQRSGNPLSAQIISPSALPPEAILGTTTPYIA